MASGPTDLRLLIAFEDEYRAYREAISTAIQELRPRTRVETCGMDSLTRELDRFDPQAVICSCPEGLDPGRRVAWVELPLEPNLTARARLGDRRFELTNPSLPKMLDVIEEAESLLHANPETPHH